MPNNMKKAGIKYGKGKELASYNDGGFTYGKRYVDPASFDGPGDYAKNTGMYLGNKMKQGAGAIKNFFGFKHGGQTKMKNGGKVPGMYDNMTMKKGGAKPDYLDFDKDGNTTEPMKNTYKKGGMYDGMDSPQPKGMFHKSFKK